MSSSFEYRDPLPPAFSALAELTDARNADGKSLQNPPRSSLLNRDRRAVPSTQAQTSAPAKRDAEGSAELSEWYTSYPEELDTSNNAYEYVSSRGEQSSRGLSLPKIR